MKKIIQWMLFPAFLLVSCIGDNMDDCAATRTLLFRHRCLYDPDESFDRWVGNDVMLYVFQDEALKMKEIIPYERIRDGNPYTFPKRYGGNIDIVAWSVPKGSATAIPQYEYGDLFNDKHVVHRMGTRDYNTFPIDLYLGVDSVKDDVVTRSTAHTIYMINCACLISITINDPAGVMMTYSDHYVLVSGVMERMNLHYYGFGQEAVVRDDIRGTTTFWAGAFGVLPSAGTQTLSFTLYGGERPLAVIKTDLKAQPGGKINLTIDLGVSVSITVNNAGWDIYPVSVQWM